HLSPTVRYLIKIGQAEQSHFTEYQGQKFKYRTDLKTAKKLVDWKKTKLESPKPSQWEREIMKYNYHISAAFYQFFEFLLTGIWKEFFWIAQESEPPFDFLIHNASQWTYNIDHSDGAIEMNTGAIQMNRLLEYWIICSERKQWSGYSIFLQPDWKGQRIGYPSVPGWYEKQTIDFFD
ncbi:MAG TPA: PD-(D/E)XK nuclease-like domain-containing protein, partial [Pelolinea sp.]|nr:PD-(D/E)XK nuclease-like domain-containing protein [Pelolinea sp.]